MPMIDVYAAADLFPAHADRELAVELTAALLRAEGIINPGPTHTNNTAAYIHRLPPSAVNTAAQGNARTVRVQVLTPPGVLSRGRQNLGAPHGSSRGRLGHRRHGVWARGIRCARREEEVVMQTVHDAVGCVDERMAG
jgi:hypothetical protein